MKNHLENRLALEIGCGGKKVMSLSIGLDIRMTSVVDILANARRLPFKDNCFDRVYSSHIIEHFSHREVIDVLREWARVLKTGGVFELLCPDLRARSLLFVLKPTWQNIKNIYGGQDYSENYHKCGFSYGLLKGLLNEVGVQDVKRVISGYMGIFFLPDSLHVKGIKSEMRTRGID
ncbi:methyltransferase domain-containing protein [Chloroflexota bacterium]